MDNIFLSQDSGVYKVIKFINRRKPGTVLSIDDFRSINGVSYTSIRTILIKLYKRNVIVRICRGIYYIPKKKENKIEYPSLEEIFSFLSKKGKWNYLPTGDYAKFVLGMQKNLPTNIVCYTTGKIKTVNLSIGINVKFIPMKKKVFKGSSNFKLLTAIQYLKDYGSTLNNEEKTILRDYIKSNKNELPVNLYCKLPQNIIKDFFE